MDNFAMARALEVFMVVRAIFPFGICRMEFGVFFLVITKDMKRVRKIVMEMVVITVDGLIVIEAFMELNHDFLGLAGLKDSHRSRTPERCRRFF